MDIALIMDNLAVIVAVALLFVLLAASWLGRLVKTVIVIVSMAVSLMIDGITQTGVLVLILSVIMTATSWMHKIVFTAVLFIAILGMIVWGG